MNILRYKLFMEQKEAAEARLIKETRRRLEMERQLKAAQRKLNQFKFGRKPRRWNHKEIEMNHVVGLTQFGFSMRCWHDNESSSVLYVLESEIINIDEAISLIKEHGAEVWWWMNPDESSSGWFTPYPYKTHIGRRSGEEKLFFVWEVRRDC